MQSLAFFNHKGGVGKTTLIFNVGLAIARRGRRIVFIDADAQANLTALALPIPEIESAYESQNEVSNLFRPLVDGSGDLLIPRPIPIRENAWIVPGHIELSAYEEICPEGWTNALAGRQRGLRVTSAPFRLAQTAANAVDAEFVVFDVGPNVGAMNRNILLACDGFVVPLAPDLFSLNALRSVGSSVAKWVSEWETILNGISQDEQINFDLPPGRPAPLGYVSHQFATYRKAPAAAYRRWLGEVPGAYRAGVVEPLREAEIALPHGQDRIGEVPNLSSLVPTAQQSNAAIFELSGSEARGAQYVRAQDTFENFDTIGQEIIRRLASVEHED